MGPVRREIAESSPWRRSVIGLTTKDPRILSPFKIGIRNVIHNTTNHEICYVAPLQVYDVMNSETGERAPETSVGCSVNFFSECYTSCMPKGIQSAGKPKITLAPHASSEETYF